MNVCPSCGARPTGTDTRCKFCGSALTSAGALISAPDLSKLEWPDWSTYPRVVRLSTSRAPSGVPELVADCPEVPGKTRSASVLATRGSFVDVDAVVTGRFLEGCEAIGLKVRTSNQGHLLAKVTATGLATIEHLDRGTNRLAMPLPFTKVSDPLHRGAALTLRLVVRGSDVRLYVDSRLVSTHRLASSPGAENGQVHVAADVGPGARRFAISSLEVREPTAG